MSMWINEAHTCNQSGPCFGRHEKSCTVLNSLFPEGKCPFQKPDRDVSIGSIPIVQTTSPSESDWTSDLSLYGEHSRLRVAAAIQYFCSQFPDECAVYNEITIVRKKHFEEVLKKWSEPHEIQGMV